MIGSSAIGEIVVKDGVRYYYEKGVDVEKGLVYLDGYYYFATYKGKLIVNTTAKIWEGMAFSWKRLIPSMNSVRLLAN